MEDAMKRLLKKTSFYKFMSVLACLFLAACGSGGGGDDFIDLGGGGGGSVCDQGISKVFNNDGGSMESKDGKATLVIAQGAIPATGSAELGIIVRCQMTSFNRVGYEVRVIQGNPPTFGLSIRYETSEIPPGVRESDLALGTFTTGPQGWDLIATAAVGNNVASAGGLNTDGIYGIFVQSSTSQGSPPTAPQNVRAVVPGSACRIDITWSPSTDPDQPPDLSAYIIFRGSTNIGTIASNQAGCCSFQDSDRLPNPPVRSNRYRYFIQAVDAAGHTTDSPDSNTITAPSSCPL
jgi:hypothetical protein